MFACAVKHLKLFHAGLLTYVRIDFGSKLAVVSCSSSNLLGSAKFLIVFLYYSKRYSKAILKSFPSYMQQVIVS